MIYPTWHSLAPFTHAITSKCFQLKVHERNDENLSSTHFQNKRDVTAKFSLGMTERLLTGPVETLTNMKRRVMTSRPFSKWNTV